MKTLEKDPRNCFVCFHQLTLTFLEDVEKREILFLNRNLFFSLLSGKKIDKSSSKVFAFFYPSKSPSDVKWKFPSNKHNNKDDCNE